jgi:general secretion pathway protein A
MGLPVERSRAALYRQIKKRGDAPVTETRIRPVLILDEAQWLRSDVLEEMRLLTDYAMDSESRLCLLFCGQTELRRRIAIAQLLRRAGTELPLFEPAAVEAIVQATGGLRRRIKGLAHHSRLAAAVAKAKVATSQR